MGLSGKGCRAKGHSFERWVAEQMRRIYPEARRLLEYQAEEANGVDLQNTGRYLIQCKRNRKYAPLSAIEEIQICPIEGGTPVLVTKGDGKTPLAVLPFEEFIRLLSEVKKKNGY